MSLHEGGTNTGAKSGTASARPGESQGGSVRPAGQWLCSSLPACCSAVPQGRVLYMSPKDLAVRSPAFPSLALPQSGEQMSDGRAQAAC